mgnify:FL=1
MKYKFCSSISNLMFSIFTCFIGVLTYAVMFLIDDKNILASILVLLILFICLVSLYYSFRNMIIIEKDKIIYVGLKKNIIFKNDITKVDSDGVRIIIHTKNKVYYISGYLTNGKWQTQKNINKNKELIENIKKSLL